MTQEDKKLLLTDLCARLPYGVICDRLGKYYHLIDIDIKRELVYLLRDDYYVPYSILRGDIIKPYLRPMSSMTKEEREYYNSHLSGIITGIDAANFMIWIYSNHLDIFHLIEKGLALKATEGMY